jgi:exosortase
MEDVWGGAPAPPPSLAGLKVGPATTHFPMRPAAAVVAALALLYSQVGVGLVRQWSTDPTASQGWLLAGAALFLLVRRWPAVRTAPLQPAVGGFALAVFAMLIYLAGSIAGDLFVQRVSLPLAMAGAVYAVAGTAHLHMLFAPIALLALAIPLPAIVVTYVTMPLQLVSSQIAADMLQASNIHVVRQGNLLVLDAITLEVAQACSGLQSLLSLTSVAAVGAALLPINAWGRLLMFVAVLPIAILGNGFRIAVTGVLSTWVGQAAVEGVVHEATGYVAFAAMCAGMFALLWIGRFSRARTAA